MPGIFVADVNPEATVDGVGLNVTHIKVKRNIGAKAAVATIKGIPQTGKNFERGQKVTAEINDEKLFEGEINKVTQANSGLITVEAYDVIYQVRNKTVKYNSEEPELARTTITTLLDESGIDNYYVAPQSDFPGGDSEGKREYGSGRQGENLGNVLDDLAKKIGGIMWADRNNQLRIEPYPDHRIYDVKYILNLDAGSGSSGNSTVIVEGGTPASEEGLASSYVYDQVKLSSRAETEEIEEGQLVINDKNIISQNEANSVAARESVNQQVNNGDEGAIEAIGNPVVAVWDRVRIPELEEPDEVRFKSIDADLTGPGGTGLAKIGEPTSTTAKAVIPGDDVFTVKSVTHTANASNGYTTTMDLAPDTKSAAEGITGPASAIADELLDKIEETEQDPGSPLNYLPGFE